MSSAILYLAIVGIWAVVLVPRWLRPSRSSGTLESNLAEPVYASPQEDSDRGAEDEDGEEDCPLADRGGQSARRAFGSGPAGARPPGPAAHAGDPHRAHGRRGRRSRPSTWPHVGRDPARADAGRLCAAAARSGPDRHRARPGGRHAARSPRRRARPGPTPGDQQRHAGPADRERVRAHRRRGDHRHLVAGSATSSTTSTPTPRCAPSATDGQPSGPPRGARRRHGQAVRFATLTAVPLGL